MRQLDLKPIQLNYSLHTLEFHISRLQVDRNFVISILQICSHLSMLLVGIIQLNKDIDAVYKYMTTLSAKTLSPMIISPSDLRELSAGVERDLIGHPKLGLPTNYNGKNIWTYYKNIKNHKYGLLRCLVCNNTCPFDWKSQWLTVYKIHNLLIHMPLLCKQLKYNLPNKFIAIWKDNLYVTYPDLDEIFSCQLSAGYYCAINNPL